MARVQMVHVPSQGEAPMTMALRSGEVKLMMTAPSPSIMGAVKEGSLKLLGVASERKSPFFPDAPTYADLGIKDASLDIWFGLWVPNNTPAEVTARLIRGEPVDPAQVCVRCAGTRMCRATARWEFSSECRGGGSTGSTRSLA